MARNEGFKYWSDQEFVQGFDANAYLMSQSVMRFDNPTDRSVSLARSLVEGMLSYDKSTTSLQLYDGTAWQTLGVVGVLDHGLLTNLGDDDHTQYLLADGTRPATELTISGDLTVNTNSLYVESSSGNVGIGTTTPEQELHVEGGIKYVTPNGGNGHLAWTSGSNYITADEDQFTYFRRYNTATDNYTLQMAFDHANERLGIGTTTPSTPLDIYRSTSTTGTADGTTFVGLQNYVGSDLSQQKTFIDFTFTDDNSNETPQVRIGAEVGQNGDANTQEKEGSGAFVVYTNNAESTSGDAGASLAERMRVDSFGNVGIGTPTPEQALEVAGRIKATGISGNSFPLELTTDTTSCRITMKDVNSTSAVVVGTETNDLVLRTNSLERVRINSSGNVGIGDTTPSYKLDVNGTGRFTSDLYVNGTLVTDVIQNDNGNSIGIEGGDSWSLGSNMSGEYVWLAAESGLMIVSSDANSTNWANRNQIRITPEGGIDERLRIHGGLEVQGPDGGMVMRYWQLDSSYGMIGTANMANSEYSLLTNGLHTYISAGSGGTVFIRGGNNDNTPELYNDGNEVGVRNGNLAVYGLCTASEFSTGGRLYCYNNSTSNVALYCDRNVDATGTYSNYHYGRVNAVFRNTNSARAAVNSFWTTSSTDRGVTFGIWNGEANRFRCTNMLNSGYVHVNAAGFTVVSAAFTKERIRTARDENGDGLIDVVPADKNRAFELFQQLRPVIYDDVQKSVEGVWHGCDVHEDRDDCFATECDGAHNTTLQEHDCDMDPDCGGTNEAPCPIYMEHYNKLHLIADEVDVVYPHAVSNRADGSVIGIDHHVLATEHINVTQHLIDAVADLQSRVNELELTT